MSASLVSTRSYGRRRRSAGARLEGAHSHASMPTIPGSPPTGNNHTAKGLPTVCEFRQKRVKSARETRKEQEASDVFPDLERGMVDPDWGKTMYSEQFGPKEVVSPVHVRIASPTRMNNPHPNKVFMQWKHPVRIHEHKKAVRPQPDVWRFLNERFYEDYMDVYNTGDAKNEVPITNLAKIKFPGKKEDNSHSGASAIIGISGRKAQLNPRQPQDNYAVESQRVLRPPSPQSLMLHHTVKMNTLPVLKDWLKIATTKERDVMIQMLKVAHDDSENKRLSKVVTDVLQPESAGRVQDWLKNASNSERQIILHVLETLAVATGEGDVHALTHPALYPHVQHRHNRHQTFPLSLRGDYRTQSCQHGMREHHCSKHQHHSHRSSSSKHSSTKNKRSKTDLESNSEMGLVGKKIVNPEKEYNRNPELWQNRILVKQHGTKLIRPGGIFNRPQKDVGQHFTIHPEWPTA